jgi:hypothetical protein
MEPFSLFLILIQMLFPSQMKSLNRMGEKQLSRLLMAYELHKRASSYTNLHANRTFHQLENIDEIRNQIVKQLRLITLL